MCLSHAPRIGQEAVSKKISGAVTRRGKVVMSKQKQHSPHFLLLVPICLWFTSQGGHCDEPSSQNSPVSATSHPLCLSSCMCEQEAGGTNVGGSLRCHVWPSAPHPSALQTQTEEEGGLAGQPGSPNRPGSGRPGHLTRPCPPQAKHLASQYWGSSRPTAVRRDPSLPYLEQYRIDAGQFRELFASLTPWACGSHTPVLAGRMFRLLDENKDSLINFKEFVTGMSE